MASHEKCASQMTTTVVIEQELSRHWAKRLAHMLDVPTETARSWVYRSMPRARRKEIALALIAECDRLEAVIADTRRRWKEVADVEADRALDRGEADSAGPQTGGVGGEVGAAGPGERRA